MAKYIDLEDAYKTLSDYYHHSTYVQSIALREALARVPAADVRPVVKAKWEVGGMFDDIGRCSNCHYMFPIDTAMTEFHFCPNCGAKMEVPADV